MRVFGTGTGQSELLREQQTLQHEHPLRVFGVNCKETQ